jgi:hypothetical protein
MVSGRGDILMGCNCGSSNCGTWKVKAYIEYEIEAKDEDEAIQRLGECIFSDLDDNASILDIAEVSAEKVSDDRIKE